MTLHWILQAFLASSECPQTAHSSPDAAPGMLSRWEQHHPSSCALADTAGAVLPFGGRSISVAHKSILVICVGAGEDTCPAHQHSQCISQPGGIPGEGCHQSRADTQGSRLEDIAQKQNNDLKEIGSLSVNVLGDSDHLGSRCFKRLDGSGARKDRDGFTD